MYAKRALIFGVTGIAGGNLAAHLNSLNDWEIHGVARQPVRGASYLTCHNVDLHDRAKAAKELSEIDPTHIFYCAWALGKDEADSIRINGEMMRAALAPFRKSSRLRHVALVTGGKHYVGPFGEFDPASAQTPFREDLPRLDKPNFYYEQEDVLFEHCEQNGCGWSVHRADTIVGYTLGNLMNMGVTLATFASICKATGRPFAFPGTEFSYNGLYGFTDARILAKQMHWAATEPDARNEAFNCVNGEVIRWRNMWATIARYFELEVPAQPVQTCSLEDFLKGCSGTWDELTEKHGLQRNPLDKLASGWHSDLDLSRPLELLMSMTKSRRLGFNEFQDSERSFIDLFDRLRAERIIP